MAGSYKIFTYLRSFLQNLEFDENSETRKRQKRAAIAGKIEVLKTTATPEMNTTQRTGIMQRWHVLQYDLLPELKNEVGVLTPKLEQVIHTLEWVKIDH